MPILPFAMAAIALYLLCAWWQYQSAFHGAEASHKRLLGVAIVAVCLHGVAALGAISAGEGINLGFFKISSLIFWIISLTFIISLLRRPLDNLAIVLLPLSALSIGVSLSAPGNMSPFSHFSGGMLVHIGSSILAYAVLTIAAVQAGALAIQDYQLRHRHTRGIVQILPPLQLMETMLFEIIWVGLALLSLSIISGGLFLDDLFAQHLVHKTVLTISAWLVFATLLWGRHQLGWRSQTAVRFTLAGFGVLMMGYFGTKLVLEIILQRV